MAHAYFRKSTACRDSIVGLIIILFLSVTALASQPFGDCLTAREVHEPCTGILLPPDQAKDGIECLTIRVPTLQLEIDFQKQLSEVYKLEMQSLVLIERKRANEYKGLLDTALKETMEPTPWHESPILWTTVGFIVGAGITVGLTYAVNR